MSDFKSKLPDLKEITSMTSKLFSDIKTSVGEIIKTYKENRAETEQKEEASEQKAQTSRKTKKTAEENTGKASKMDEDKK